MSSGGAVTGGAARQAARAELRHPEYHRGGPGWFARAVDWVGDHLARLFAGGGGSDALLLILVAVLVIGILLAVRAGVPARRAVGREADEGDPLAPVTARDHRRIAAELTAQGRNAEALREWLRAAVQTIEDRGVLPPRPGRTGAMTAREAGPLLPQAAVALAGATAAFDEVWFGGRAATPADVALARSAADGVAGARVTTAAGATSPGLEVPQ